MVEATINLATISAELVAQGDGELASGDIVQCISLPQGTVILNAGVEIMTTVAGSTALTVDLGITGVDDDAWITAIDIGSSTSYVATDYVSPAGAAGLPIVVGYGAAGATSDTLDIVFDSVVGSLTAGVLRVWAVVADAASMKD
jgi:hypothetical protein